MTRKTGNSLVFQWLELHAFIVYGLGSISGCGHKLLGKKKKRKEKFTRHPKTHVGLLVWKDKCNVIMFEVYNRPSQNRGLSLRSYFLQGDIFLNKQCPIFRKTMSPSHSLGCPLHPPEHLKQSQESKRRPGKGEKFLPSFQTLPPFPFPGHSPACPRCVQN